TAAQQVTAIQATVPGKTSIWYNSLFYMAVFGLLGGLVAWGVGEAVYQGMSSPLDEYMEFLGKANTIFVQARDGDISEVRAEAQLEALAAEYDDNPYIRIARDDSMSDFQKEAARDRQLEKDKRHSQLKSIMFIGLVGLILAMSLSIAEPVVSRNWRSAGISSCVGIFLGLIGGVIVGLFVDHLYRALGAGSDSTGKQMFARSVAWGVVGLFLAIAPGIVMRSWKRLLIGIAGGLVGGLLGGLLFDPIAKLTENAVVSRLVGLIAIGVLAAVGTGIIEKAAKTGWLKVVAGLIAGKQFILYRNPTNIGSSPQCEIYLFKDTQVAPRHAAIHVASGGCELENASPGNATFVNGQAVSRKRLRNGDRIQIGGTVFEYQEKDKR
ncbi:MAG TPA: FHA domain-containing protein, partial [Bacillota bacterium]|nr:FHA domain-containing protein [Bacillota bacterium]